MHRRRGSRRRRYYRSRGRTVGNWLRSHRRWLTAALLAIPGALVASYTFLDVSGIRGSAQPFSPVTQVELPPPAVLNGRPQLTFLPGMEEVWECEVTVIGGTLGGIAAAAHAMQAGAQTCMIELTPWLGGQISSQGVSALDESAILRQRLNYSPSWARFRDRIANQPVALPDWVPLSSPQLVDNLNSCWVGTLCFLPSAGATAAQELIEDAVTLSPGSQWATSTAFKGAEFDSSGREITAVYGVRRIPTNPNYVPSGRFSTELSDWYSWSPTPKYDKIPIRMQPPPGKRMIVIDATDTGEFIGWAGLPHRVGSESHFTTGEVHAATWDNPECTQAFTYPFVLGIHDDQGKSLNKLAEVEPVYALHEHINLFDMEGFEMFKGRSFFHYRRILSTTLNHPMYGSPAAGDLTMVNWNRGNDWIWMEPALVFTQEQIRADGQRGNWMGGISTVALKQAEIHALLFARWLLETKATAEYPLAYLDGAEAPMGTESGLSMVPYIREGRRILGRSAYGEDEFMVREQDLRIDLPGGRNFVSTMVGYAHYDIDIHGCRYRNWESSGEAASAGTGSSRVRPLRVPIESIIPQEVDNLMIGGKAMAVTHIANAMTRIHYNEWQVGGAAGAIAAWLVLEDPDGLTPAEIVPQQRMPEVQDYLMQQGLRLYW